MKWYLIIVICLLSEQPIFSQGEESYWTFGRKYSLDFSTQPPTLNDNHPLGFPLSYYNSISISSNTGGLLFSVRFNGDFKDPSINHIYDRDDNPVTGTNLLGNVQLSGAPVVVQNGGNDNQYYIFYVRDKACIIHCSTFL